MASASGQLEARHAALVRQKAHTYLAGGVIFLDPITGRRYVDDKPPRMQWNAALKGLGMRHRVAYQTRHTFATLALMAGANPMWVSRQLGHSTMQMTLSRYSRWIDQADQRREVRARHLGETEFGEGVAPGADERRAKWQGHSP